MAGLKRFRDPVSRSQEYLRYSSAEPLLLNSAAQLPRVGPTEEDQHQWGGELGGVRHGAGRAGRPPSGLSLLEHSTHCRTVLQVCLPPCAGTADVFFKQCLGLSGRGVRVLAVQWPPYWSVQVVITEYLKSPRFLYCLICEQEWCEGFAQLLDRLSLEQVPHCMELPCAALSGQVHIFGAALGGFLGQKFAEESRNCPRVASLILCNSFTDTAIFKSEEEAAGLWMLPAVVLKKLVMGGLEAGERPDNAMLQATDFILERLDTLSQSELAARLTLNTGEARRPAVTVVWRCSPGPRHAAARQQAARHPYRRV